MSKELRIGIISLVIIALGIWGYNFLKGQDLFNPNSRQFKVEYASINGLSKASLVTINGLKVGKVDNIKFNENKKGSLIVSFSMQNDFQFSKKSIVKIYSPNPLGGSNLAILPNYEGEIAVSGDFLKGEIEESLFSSIGERLDPIQSKLNYVLVGADSLLGSINQVLNKHSRKSLNRSIINLEKTITTVNKTLASVNGLIGSNRKTLTTTLENTKVITDNFSKISNDLAKANLGKTVKQLESTLHNVNGLLASVNNGKGTLGKLITDDKMYTNLTNASKEMEELLREMKLNPKRFVHFSLFGKRPKPYNEKNNQKNINNN